MTHHDDLDHARDTALLRQLQDLPREMRVPADGWTRLQAALPMRAAEEQPGAKVIPLRRLRHARWSLPAGAALAASLALYWVLPLPLQPAAPPAPTVLQQQAAVMTDAYRQAMAALPPVDAPEWRPALVELDRGADQIRDALQQSPRSRHLLEQLQRTYALRLELTRQATCAASGLPT